MKQLTLRIAAVCMTLIWGAALVAAPGPRDMAAQAEAMKKLSFLEGEWSGEKKTTMPDGSTSVSRSEDDIKYMVNGTILTVLGRSYGSNAADAKQVGENFGVLTYDERTRQYGLRTYAQGIVSDGKVLSVEKGAARWEMRSDGGIYRFDVSARGANEWNEVIDVSTDGGRTWKPFVQIRFTRKQ
jgi:hypothetical protein